MKRFPAGSAAATFDRYSADKALTEIEDISRPWRAELSLKSASDLLLSSVTQQHQNQGWVIVTYILKLYFQNEGMTYCSIKVNICALTTVAHRHRWTAICLIWKEQLVCQWEVSSRVIGQEYCLFVFMETLSVTRKVWCWRTWFLFNRTFSTCNLTWSTKIPVCKGNLLLRLHKQSAF